MVLPLPGIRVAVLVQQLDLQPHPLDRLELVLDAGIAGWPTAAAAPTEVGDDGAIDEQPAPAAGPVDRRVVGRCTRPRLGRRAEPIPELVRGALAEEAAGHLRGRGDIGGVAKVETRGDPRGAGIGAPVRGRPDLRVVERVPHAVAADDPAHDRRQERTEGHIG